MKASRGERLFYFCNYAILSFAGLSCLVPLIHLFSLSFSDPHAVMSGDVTLWPIGFTWETYGVLFNGTRVLGAFWNSVVITVVGVVLSMLFTVMAAYPLSRSHFYARRPWTLVIVFTMLFSGGLIPTFLVVKSLGLLNTYGALWLPGLISTFNMLIMKTFFENIPEELIEAAKMDGCSELRLLVQVVIPLSLPVMATLTLFYGVGYWNSFFSLMIYIQDTTKLNLAVLVQQMIQSQTILQEINNVQPDDIKDVTPETIKAAGVIVMLFPMLAVYPFLQRFFVKGVMIGAIKG